jgi:cohesin complex subunit SA-1/2
MQIISVRPFNEYLLDLKLIILSWIQAFESLWDDVTQQFLKHTAVDVLDQAVRTIQYFLVNPVLGRSNAMKINELEERLVELLREGVANKNLKTSTFDRDEPLVLAGCLGRISKLYAIRDISVALDDTDEDKLSSAWEIVDALSERGHLGYKSEGLVRRSYFSAR